MIRSRDAMLLGTLYFVGGLLVYFTTHDMFTDQIGQLIIAVMLMMLTFIIVDDVS